MANSVHDRGDTLVEVLMAIVILSIVIVGSITIMTRGLRSAQIALEHTQVRLQMSGQTELLHYLRDSYLKDKGSVGGLAWADVVNNFATTTPSTYNSTVCAVSLTKNGNAFYIDRNGAGDPVVKNYTATIPASGAVPGQGLWIEATNSTVISPAYVDFQLRACWTGPGNSGNQQTITSVRLYDPAH